MGWLMGLEPTDGGITIRCVNHFATATAEEVRVAKLHTGIEESTVFVSLPPFFLAALKLAAFYPKFQAFFVTPDETVS